MVKMWRSRKKRRKIVNICSALVRMAENGKKCRLLVRMVCNGNRMVKYGALVKMALNGKIGKLVEMDKK